MLQESGAILTSQLVKANKASMVLSGLMPAGKCMSISTCSAVLSSIFFTLIFPFSFALSIESMRLCVVVLNGTCVITKVFLSS